jgi:hypothetical protein
VAQVNNEPMITKKYVFNKVPDVPKISVPLDSSHDAVLDHKQEDDLAPQVKVVKLDET